jgi:hypothetical protein
MFASFSRKEGEKANTHGRLRASVEPSARLLCELVMVLHVMHSVLTFRIYKNGAQ